MNRRRILWVPVILLAGLLIGLPAAGQKKSAAEVLLQAAAQKATVEGNLQEAIRLCLQILAEHPDNRPSAAKALVQIGECYEKLGTEEARKAYERVLNEYADQSDQVRLARARLAALGKPAVSESGIVTRRVWSDSKTDFFGAVSPDGKYLSFVDWETGDLAIRDLEKAANRRLTNKGSWEANPNEEAEGSIWSPDSRQVAYTWMQSSTKSPGYELRLISLDSPTPRVLYRCASTQEYIYPIDWSPDGKHILGVINDENADQRLVLVSVTDGTVRTLKKLPYGVGLPGAAISPDGRYVLYDYPQSESSLAHDIFLLPVAGGKETSLVEYPADDRVLGWAPDGKLALFASDRRGSVDVWAVRLQEGKPQDIPVMVKPAVGRIEPLGLTRSGSFYYGVGGDRNDVYVAKMDSATGSVVSPPTKLVKRFEGCNGGPQYSPDGKYLAHVSRRAKTGVSAGTGYGDTLCIRSLETGEEREYQREITRLGVRGFSRPLWSPDGRSVLLFGRDSMGRYGIYHVVLETGKSVSILRSGSDLDVGAPAGWRDGKSFLYGRVDKKNSRGEVCVRYLDTGEERVLYSVLTKGNWGVAVSSDRQWLSVLDRSEEGARVLNIISTQSGAIRRLIKFNQNEAPGFIRHAWSADGKYVYYTRRVAVQDSFKFEVWRVPVDGGQPQKTGLEMPGAIDYVSAHPDGEHLAFENMAPMSVSPAEVWVMENFLPKNK